MKRKALYPLTAFVIVLIFHAAYSIWKAIRISRKWVQMGDINWLRLYLERRDYFLGISYALAGAFTIYALTRFLERRRSGTAGVIGGLTLAGVLYVGGCFLLGCCGSPMLVVYLGLFGSSFLGFAKPLVLILTATSVAIGFFWMEKKDRACCAEGEQEDECYDGQRCV